ncbi:MAG: tRNA pseudouridine(55) synthase TruB [Acidobacteriota bacterium]
MDGVLVIDKPAGPTSHDVVARVRRAIGERRIGHTGTLDPAASGVLPLVVGRATRLAQFLSARDKSYDAIIRLGSSTDTGDAQGRVIGVAHTGALPSRTAIDAALETFRGAHDQQPPAYSAKRIGGTRSYQLARARARGGQPAAGIVPLTDAEPAGADPVLPAPVRVTAHAIDVQELDGDTLSLRIDCSAGFYVRSLAHDLGVRLGTGAHLAGLRRIRSGDFTLRDSAALDAVERDRDGALTRLVPLAGLLHGFPSVVLTAAGVRHACHGRDLGPADLTPESSMPAVRSDSGDRALPGSDWIRLLDGDGALLGLARYGASRVLHPSVVLV